MYSILTDGEIASEAFAIVTDPFRTILIEKEEWTRINFTKKVFFSPRASLSISLKVDVVVLVVLVVLVVSVVTFCKNLQIQ